MQIVAASVGVALAAIGVLHLVWAVSPWPLATRADLARTVVGRPDGDLPIRIFAPATVAVAVALVAAGYLVAVEGDLVSSRLPDTLVTVGALGVALVLLARGVWGVIESGFGLGEHPASYRKMDLTLYSPLCVVLGVLTVVVAL